jgi:hypothetical protein
MLEEHKRIRKATEKLRVNACSESVRAGETCPRPLFDLIDAVRRKSGETEGRLIDRMKRLPEGQEPAEVMDAARATRPD